MKIQEKKLTDSYFYLLKLILVTTTNLNDYPPLFKHHKYRNHFVL